MSIALYHGSRSRDIIQDIDTTKTKRAKEAHGFNMTPDVNAAERYAGWSDKDFQGGFVYSVALTDKDAKDANYFDNYNNKNGQKWLVNTAPVDEAMVKRLATSMRDMGQTAQHDFRQGGDDLERRFKAGHLNDYSTRQLVEQLQGMYGKPEEGKAGQKNSADIFRGAGYAGIHVQTNNSVVIFDPDAVGKPAPYGFHNPNNPESSAVGGVLKQLNQTEGLPGGLDRGVRQMVAQAVLDTEDKKPSAYKTMQSVRGVLEGSGVPLPQGLQDQLMKAEDASARAAGISPEQVATLRQAQQQVRERPMRQEGEGFVAYKDRVFAEFDRKRPDATVAEQQAFNGALHDTLYRDAQRRYADVTGDAMGIKQDPSKLERMLIANGTDQTRALTGVAYVEMEAGSLNGLPPQRRAYGALRQPLGEAVAQAPAEQLAATAPLVASVTAQTTATVSQQVQQHQGHVARRTGGSGGGPGGMMG